ncbi:MAG: ion transporter [Rhodospirillaceae bacterium]
MSDALSAETVTAQNGGRLQAFVESERFRNFIIGVILLNAAVLGLETSQAAQDAAGGLLKALDLLALAVFVVEIGLKFVVYRLGFFKNAWNVFDFVIVGIALIPSAEGLSVLRALRVLRAFRLLSMIPKMRGVVQALLAAIPAMGSVVAILSLVFYVFAVMATKLFGQDFPQWFGSIAKSLYSLFQIMTLESWSMGIVRPVMEVHPYAWLLFVPFILVTTFAVLNLFIAVMVNSMHDVTAEDIHHQDDMIEDLTREVRELRTEIRALRTERTGG